MYSYWGSVVDAKKQKAAATAAATICDLPDFFETLSVEEKEEEHDHDHD